VDTEEFDQILRHTLSDYRVSRGEKRVLERVFQEMDPDEHQMGILRHRVFDLAREELTDPRSVSVLEWLEEVLKLLQPRQQPESAERAPQAYFSPGEDCRRKVVSLLNHCRQRVDICVFTITDDHITSAILDAKGRDLRIRVITDDDKAEDAGSDVHRLARAGIPVRVDKTPYHMHHKFALFDDTQLVTGSYNWTRSAAMYNEENLIVVEDKRLTTKFARQFEQLWENLK
jgi:mitochondrial cardiolipin hydrolase